MEEEKNDKLKFLNALSFAWQLGLLILIPLGGFFLLGRWLDKMLKTSPFLMISGIIVGLAISILSVYHSLLPIIKK